LAINFITIFMVLESSCPHHLRPSTVLIYFRKFLIVASNHVSFLFLLPEWSSCCCCTFYIYLFSLFLVH